VTKNLSRHTDREIVVTRGPLWSTTVKSMSHRAHIIPRWDWRVKGL